MKKKKLVLCVVAMLVLALSACGEKKETITDEMIEAAKEDALAGGRSNRELTRAEIMGQYEAQEQYLHEGRRAPERSDEELPVLLMLEDASGNEMPYWVYPETEMTEEQLLAAMDIKYGGVSPGMYSPREGQLSYEEAKARVRELIEEYDITDAEINKVYLLYWSNREMPMITEDDDHWNVMISCKSGYDYQMKFRANNGDLLMWCCKLPGYYDAARMPELLTEEDWIIGDYTTEQIEAVAATYMEKIGMADQVSEYKIDINMQPGNPEEPPRYRVSMQMGTEEEPIWKDIYLDARDLSVWRLQMGNIF